MRSLLAKIFLWLVGFRCHCCNSKLSVDTKVSLECKKCRKLFFLHVTHVGNTLRSAKDWRKNVVESYPTAPPWPIEELLVDSTKINLDDLENIESGRVRPLPKEGGEPNAD